MGVYVSVHVYLSVSPLIDVVGLGGGREHETRDHYIYTYTYTYIYWLVVSTPLKNISQLGLLFPIYGKIKKVANHHTYVSL